MATNIERPDWKQVMGEQANPDDNECVIITRGTARLAASAIREQNARDYYHNYGAAERELTARLQRPAASAMQKIENLNAALAKCEHYCATQTGAPECNCGSWYFRKTGPFSSHTRGNENEV